MLNVFRRCSLVFTFIGCSVLLAQDPTGIIEGQIADASKASIPHAIVVVTNAVTGVKLSQYSALDGQFHFPSLSPGQYHLHVAAAGFADFDELSIHVDVGQRINIPITLQIASSRTQLNVEESGAMLDVSPSLGNVVSSREATDLPLNGRNLTQLGLLQPGVAPMTFGLAEAGGILRSGQAYAVNGEPPESNNYLLDGVTNVDSVNGGFALRVPVDAVNEFRILTLNAPAEYGETSGATTSIVTKSGGNEFHGDVYDFLRNNAFDARNFFAAKTEPLHQNQFGATLGGPVRRTQDFFFLYYEGQRDRQGKTQAAIVPTAAERSGDFSGLIDPRTGNPKPLINYFTGTVFPGNKIPGFMISPIARAAEKLYPLGNISPSIYSATEMTTNDYDQGSFRLDHYFHNNDKIFARYATSSLNAFDPLP